MEDGSTQTSPLPGGRWGGRFVLEHSDKNKSSSKKRCIRLLISSLNNQTFIHTSIKNSDNNFNVDADSRWEELGLMNVKHNIDDNKPYNKENESKSN